GARPVANAGPQAASPVPAPALLGDPRPRGPGGGGRFDPRCAAEARPAARGLPVRAALRQRLRAVRARPAAAPDAGHGPRGRLPPERRRSRGPEMSANGPAPLLEVE